MKSVELKLDKSAGRKLTLKDEPWSAKSNLSESVLLSSVWELTKEVFGLAGGYDVESRLQRNIVRVVRP